MQGAAQGGQGGLVQGLGKRRVGVTDAGQILGRSGEFHGHDGLPEQC